MSPVTTYVILATIAFTTASCGGTARALTFDKLVARKLMKGATNAQESTPTPIHNKKECKSVQAEIDTPAEHRSFSAKNCLETSRYAGGAEVQVFTSETSEEKKMKDKIIQARK